jgi:hypothetical protein
LSHSASQKFFAKILLYYVITKIIYDCCEKGIY